jgi:hypothetical protein
LTDRTYATPAEQIRVTAVAVVDQADIADRGAIRVVTTVTGLVAPQDSAIRPKKGHWPLV